MNKAAQSSTAWKAGLLLCGLSFAAAVWGSLYCGGELMQGGLTAEREQHLYRLIYFHFALSQIAVIGAIALYWKRKKSSYRHRYYLIVSYNANGKGILPPGLEAPTEQIWYSCLGQLQSDELPPADGTPLYIYPMMMQSGYSSGERLEQELHAAYGEKISRPELFIQPVFGASPWLAERAASQLKHQLREGEGILVAAHHPAGKVGEVPELALFCRRLRQHLPEREIEQAHFGQEAQMLQRIASMKAQRIYLLPFLLTSACHTRQETPADGELRKLGKTIEQGASLGEMLKIFHRGD